MTTETISVNLPNQIPLTHNVDVLVAGGGPGGIGAAIGAARKGVKVLLVEHYGFLGGMATAGEVNPFMNNHHEGKPLDTGIFTEWLNRIKSYNPDGFDRIFDPHCARLAAEDLCLEAGVEILYHHRVAHVERKGSRIDHVVLHSKSGLTAVKANIIVDSTGDGDVAFLAGAPFEMGGENTPYVQPMTLCFKLKLNLSETNLNYKSAGEAFKKEYDLIQEVYQKAKVNGETDNPRENVLMFTAVNKDVLHFNTTRVIKKSSVNGIQLSEAELEARKQMREIITILRRDVPCFEKATLYSVAPQIGIRESRRILGSAYVTREDYTKGKAFPDAIARVTYPIDIHSPNGTGTEITHLPKGAWYEIPYGCIVVKGLDNLLIGSRCISVDHAVHSSMRVMPPVCSIGQAAGTAAAIAHQQNIKTSEIDGIKLNAELKSIGRNLTEYDPTREWETMEPGDWKTIGKKEKALGKFMSS
ncbi:MAG: FAD-dependent oxidoreductase [Planctomycetota bacterium]|nr:MAG: FAD-dependent oxidoreductase [Planctomycetota bacterium]